MAELETFPPREHFLKDLAPRIVRSADGGAEECRTRIASGLLNAAGEVRASVLATLVDVIAGTVALQAADPDWVLTADFDLRVLGRSPEAGEVLTRPRVLRAGERAVVVEAESLGLAGETATPLARSFMTFSVLPRRPDTPRFAFASDDLRRRLAEGGRPFEEPLFDVVGIEPVDAAGGVVEIGLRPYVDNATGMLQGGVVAMLAEAGAEQAAACVLGAPAAVTDVDLRYLAPARVGPVRTRTTLLRRHGGHGEHGGRDARDGAGAAWSGSLLLRVDVHDEGADRAVAAALCEARSAEAEAEETR